LSVEVVRKPPKPLPEEVARIWAAKWLSGVGEEVGGGKNLFLLRPKQTDEQGLRAIVRQSRGVRLRGYDPFDGEAVSPWLGPLTVSRRSVLGNSPGGGLAARLFLHRVGDSLLKRHRPTLPPRLLPRLLAHTRAHIGNALVSLGEPVGVSGNALCLF
jgi:hypothetical protein